MSIITLTTDFGLKDYYVSAVKGKIMGLAPKTQIVDISHQINLHDILEAAFVIKNAYKNFPKDTIHIIGVGSSLVTPVSYIVVKHHDHYFITADNGILSLMFEDEPEKIVEIDTGGNSFTFPARDIFSRAACFLANGGEITDIGKSKTNTLKRSTLQATSIGDIIQGIVVHNDIYGNSITNIPRTLFESIGKNRSFIINLPYSRTIKSISKNYFDVPEGEILALFNTEGFLEIAMRNGSGETMVGVQTNSQITINFL